MKKLWHESAMSLIRVGVASRYQYVPAIVLWPRYVDSATMCFVIRSRSSGQVSSALTANEWRKEWIVGRTSPGPRGRPIFSIDWWKAVSASPISSLRRRKETNTWLSNGAKERLVWR